MKATKYLSLAALALMGTLTSCQSDDEATIARPANAVGINVTVGSLQTTRSNPASTDYEEAHLFNQGDQVCVSTEGQDPVLFQCQNKNDQTWAEAEAGKFLLWTASEMTFKAYYPATTGTSMTAFTLPADQSTEAKIALADYMTRQQTRTSDNGTDIYLQLERKTARVIVRIADFNDQYNNDQKTVSNVLINSQFSAIADGDGTGDITAVTPYAQNGTGGVNTTYTALVVPGDGDSGATFITLTDALNNTLTVKGIPELREGYSYTYNLTVGKNTIQVQSVTVADWATGATLAGGQAAAEGHALSVSAVGEIVGSDGKAYAVADKDNLPEGVTAAGMVAYKNGSNGLVIALADEANDMNWDAAKGENGAAAHTPKVTGYSWKLPSKDEWNQMFGADVYADNANYTNLNTAITNAGGTALQKGDGYWSSSEYDGVRAYHVDLYDGVASWYSDSKEDFVYRVRACFAFTEEQGGAAEGHALSASAVGEIVGTDGKAYAVTDKDNLPEGVTAVAMVAYKSETTGSSLAIALADEANKMDWSTANSTCEGKTAIGGNSWKLPSQEEWKQMFSANGGDEDSYIGLNDALAAAGGDSSKLQELVNYWSSSEVGSEIRCVSFINDHANWGSGGKDFEFWVRACFAF